MKLIISSVPVFLKNGGTDVIYTPALPLTVRLAAHVSNG